MASLKAVLLLFMLPLLLSHLLSTVAVSASGSGGPPDILLPITKLEQAGHVKMPLFPEISFFSHDTIYGPDPSAVVVAWGPFQSSTGFGMVRVMDDPLTIGPDRSSKQIGKSQGIYVSADKQTVALLMVMTITFFDGDYAGSSLTVVGRNEFQQHEQEMTITGGTGLFRFTKGYVLTRTHSYDPANGYTVVENKCYFN